MEDIHENPGVHLVLRVPDEHLDQQGIPGIVGLQPPIPLPEKLLQLLPQERQGEGWAQRQTVEHPQAAKGQRLPGRRQNAQNGLPLCACPLIHGLNEEVAVEPVHVLRQKMQLLALGPAQILEIQDVPEPVGVVLADVGISHGASPPPVWAAAGAGHPPQGPGPLLCH